MKTFSFVALAALVVTTEAGLAILSPSCTLLGPSGQQLNTNDQCKSAMSKFNMMYKGKNQKVAGQVLRGLPCDPQHQPAGCYSVNEALFGINPYGEEIAGQLFYNFMTDLNKDGCDNINPTFSNAKNNNNVAFKDNDASPTFKILLVDRGNCSFVRKVRMGQNAGAAAVIIMDNTFNHHKKVFMSNDGSGDDIKIPSMFVDYETGMKLKTALRTWGDNTVRVSLDWALPESEGKVRWSLWTSAEDRVAHSFKENFQLAFQRLGAKHQIFTPHFQIVDGSPICIRKIGANTVNLCGDQCIYDGRYCAISSDPKLSSNVKGKDIVNENFRQLCIFNVTASGDRDKATSMWWDYIDFFALNCNNNNAQYSKICSEKQMRKAGYTQKNIDMVVACTGDTDKPSKYDYTTTVGSTNSKPYRRNLVLDVELQQQKEDGIFTIPTILINGQHYRGGYTCPHPPQLASCGVLTAVCSAYIDGQEPPACANDYCWDLLDDCNTCLKAEVYPTQKNLLCCEKNASKSFDSCGHCLANTDPNFNKCYQRAQTKAAKDKEAADRKAKQEDDRKAKEDTGAKTGVVAGIVTVFVVLLLVIGGVVAAAFIMLKKKDQETRRYVDSVVSSYLPMEDGNHEGEDETASLAGNAGSTATL